MSRNQSLIKKNIAPNDLRPSDVLIERFVGWKIVVKQLIAYFEVRPLHWASNADKTDNVLVSYRVLRILRIISHAR